MTRQRKPIRFRLGRATLIVGVANWQLRAIRTGARAPRAYLLHVGPLYAIVTVAADGPRVEPGEEAGR